MCLRAGGAGGGRAHDVLGCLRWAAGGWVLPRRQARLLGGGGAGDACKGGQGGAGRGGQGRSRAVKSGRATHAPVQHVHLGGVHGVQDFALDVLWREEVPRGVQHEAAVREAGRVPEAGSARSVRWAAALGLGAVPRSARATHAVPSLPPWCHSKHSHLLYGQRQAVQRAGAVGQGGQGGQRPLHPHQRLCRDGDPRRRGCRNAAAGKTQRFRPWSLSGVSGKRAAAQAGPGASDAWVFMPCRAFAHSPWMM